MRSHGSTVKCWRAVASRSSTAAAKRCRNHWRPCLMITRSRIYVCFLLAIRYRHHEGIHGGGAKVLTFEEARMKLEELRGLGLVQVISNLQHPLSLCSCCSCCCLCLRTMARNEDNMTIRSRFTVQVIRPDQCIGCGQCAAVCQMDAVSFSDTGVSIHPDKCIGCGQCVSRCPKGVLKMKALPDAAGPDRYSIDRIVSINQAAAAHRKRPRISKVQISMSAALLPRR